MNDNRIDELIELINESGIKIGEYKPIRGGINSQVYKLIDDEGNIYALKLYTKSISIDSINRYQSEINFITLLRKFNITCCTEIVIAGQSCNWLLFKWLQGQKIKSLSDDNISQICDFIIKINSNQVRHAAANTLSYASEAIASSNSVRFYLNKRINCLLSVDLHSSLQKEIAQWISLELYPKLQQELNLFSVVSNQKYWRDCNIGTFVSPSDIGIHNILDVGGKLHFIDFEYAGLDDISKLVCDLIVHPEYSFSIRDQEYFYSYMLANWNEFRSVEFERCRSMYSLQALKWTMILLNKFRDNTISESSWLKAQSYYNRYFDV